MRKINILLVFLAVSQIMSAQVVISSGNDQPHPSAMLEVSSSSKGLLPPRMTFTEINNIASPAVGLIVFCTNCGPAGSGALVLFNNGGWYSLTTGCIMPQPPDAGIHVAGTSQITWNWLEVPSALGYRWNITNDFASATDLGNLTSKTETGLSCNTSYIRYAWSYNDCGNSIPLSMSHSTSACPFNCGSTITISHMAGEVAPVNKTVSYGTVDNVAGEPAKCWITRNLGASQQAISVNDIQEASAGWYWQFNKKQGYQHDGTARTPQTAWINPNTDSTNWKAINDPCTIELGSGWRIPTLTEWLNVKTANNWTNWNGPWNSLLKMHGAGLLYNSNGNLMNRGSRGDYWSSTINVTNFGNYIDMHSGYVGTSSSQMSNGYTLRCLKE